MLNRVFISCINLYGEIQELAVYSFLSLEIFSPEMRAAAPKATKPLASTSIFLSSTFLWEQIYYPEYWGDWLADIV